MSFSPRSTSGGNAKANTPQETITGSITKRVFFSEETGYFVAKINLDGGAPNGAEVVAITGHCSSLWEGEEVRARGHWRNHPEYGLQFAADEISCIPPSSATGLCRYLSGGIVRGIGPKLAKRIVDHFGEDTFRILEKESVRLAEVEGISRKKSQMIKKAWDTASASRDVMIFLQGHGISLAMATKIYREYGPNTVASVKQNPYRLAADVEGIGFLKADAIAQKMGIAKDSPLRARAGIYFTLQKCAEEGDCFCEKPTLILTASERLGIPVDIIQEALEEELKSPRLVNDDERIYLLELFRAERAVATRLLGLQKARASLPPIQAARALDWVASKLPFALSPVQRQAVNMALTNKLSVITGGPGVGKTTIIRALCEIWGAKKAKIYPVAPTGRAARRLGESTGIPAQTIHRLLKWNPQTAKFVYNSENPLPGDVVIVDESSMIDIELASSLLAALPLNATLVFVGDIDQLPSVGPGNVLRDMIASEVIPVTRLIAIFRQKTGGNIVLNAHRVNEGHFFEEAQDPKNSDFFFIPCTEPEKIVSRVLELVRSRIPAAYHFSPLEDIQVLSPMRKTLLGVDELNYQLQQELNPAGRALQHHQKIFRVGDRVMQMHNNYDKDVFNGDIGFVRSVSPQEHSLSVDFDGHEVAYENEEIDDLTLAYATTIHKSQGSEYPAVVILIATHHYTLLQRNLLYTAITRGRKLVCVVGQAKAVRMAVQNNEPVTRQTALAQRLREGLS